MGKLLLTTNVGGPIGGGIATYRSKGKQYVALAVGMKNAIMHTDSGSATVVIYASTNTAVAQSAATTTQ
jgi:hypothetical protein